MVPVLVVEIIATVGGSGDVGMHALLPGGIVGIQGLLCDPFRKREGESPIWLFLCDLVRVDVEHGEVG